MHEFCVYAAWPGWKPEVWAAWVQAVMSVAAIFAAALLPRWIDKRKRLDGAEQFLIFSQLLLEKAEELKSSLASEASRRGLEMWGHTSEWQTIADAARELPLNELPHARYLSTWLQIREMSARLTGFYRGLLSDGEWGDPEEEGVIGGYLYRLRNLHNELIDIDRSVRGESGHTKVDNPD